VKAGIRIVLMAALLAPPTVALAATGPTKVLVPNCTKAVYKPKRIVLACGDGSNYLTNLTWHGWTALSATGSGVDVANDCMPDCVGGHVHSYPATVTLSRPKRCPRMKRHKVFGRIVVRYAAAHPGNSSTMTAPLACPF
jgi:hypothetical protein